MINDPIWHLKRQNRTHKSNNGSTNTQATQTTTKILLSHSSHPFAEPLPKNTDCAVKHDFPGIWKVPTLNITHQFFFSHSLSTCCCCCYNFRYEGWILFCVASVWAKEWNKYEYTIIFSAWDSSSRARIIMMITIIAIIWIDETYSNVN